MVRMEVVSSPNIAVTVELDGGIRNLACEDVDETCCTNRQTFRTIDLSTDKSTERLANRTTKKFDAEGVSQDCDETDATSQAACKKIMNACRSLWQWHLLFNALIFISVAAFLYAVEFGVIPHQQIGFYCHDPRLSIKHTGETIGMITLLSGSIFLPLIVMWITEWLCHKSESYKSSGCTGTRGKQIWSWFGNYTVGIVAVICVCDFAKVVIGEPRPHFFDTCKPRELENCTNEFVPHYTCTNTEENSKFVADASKSFPSGHAALSTFTSVYLLWYVQSRLPRRATTALFKPWSQVLIITWSLVCSLTRILDNRHHWWDVLAGVMLGAVGAYFSVRLYCRGFSVQDSMSGMGHGDPLENGHHGYDGGRHQSVKKLLSNTSVDTREMGDAMSTWKG